MKTLLAVLLAAAAAPACAALRLPGSTWGSLSHDLDGIEGNATQGFVRQGVEWFEFRPLKLSLRTNVEYNWRLRTQNERYFNMLGPVVGVELRRSPFSLGLSHVWRRFPDRAPALDVNEFQLKGSWYKVFDLGQPTFFGWDAHGAPLTLWGNVFYDLDQTDGSGTQGFVRQGIEWFEFAFDAVFETYASYNWRFRSRNKAFFDALGPSLGARVRWRGIDVGIARHWRRFPELPRRVNDWEAFLSWYTQWDLKRK